MSYKSAGKLLVGGLMAAAAVGSGAGVAYADNEQGVVRNSPIGTANAGPSEVRTSDIGTALGTGGSGDVTRSSKPGVVQGTGGVNGSVIDGNIAKVQTCADNAASTTGFGNKVNTIDVQMVPVLPDMWFNGGNVDC